MKKPTNFEEVIQEKKKAVKKIKMRYKRFDKSLPALYKESEMNVGYDLFARLDKPITLKPGETARIPLNVATEIPYGVVGLVFQRSSTFKKWGIRLTNSVGVIDPSYCGDGDEWLAEVQNMTNAPITINPGDKICQAVFLPVVPLEIVEVESLGNKDRGGFGTSFNNAMDIKEAGK